MLAGKRGQEVEVWKTIFSILLLVAAITATQTLVNRVVEDDSFIRAYYAKDTALLTDTLLAVPGEAKIRYPVDKGSFDFEFGDGRVEVSSDNDWNKFPYAQSSDVQDYPGNNTLEAPDSFVLRKTKDNVTAGVLG